MTEEQDLLNECLGLELEILKEQLQHHELILDCWKLMDKINEKKQEIQCSMPNCKDKKVISYTYRGFKELAPYPLHLCLFHYELADDWLIGEPSIDMILNCRDTLYEYLLEKDKNMEQCKECLNREENRFKGFCSHYKQDISRLIPFTCKFRKI